MLVLSRMAARGGWAIADRRCISFVANAWLTRRYSFVLIGSFAQVRRRGLRSRFSSVKCDTPSLVLGHRPSGFGL